ELKSYLELSLASKNESPLEWSNTFSKVNMKFMNVFVPSWDVNEDIE
ncbi:18711_t:CDS:2, partial [Entrophospora sp. SA101]